MHESTDQVSSKTAKASAKWIAASLLGGALIWSGCTAAHYRRAADKEVYQIVQQAELQVFGQTNELTIDTPYSARKPQEVLPSELIEDRLQKGQRLLTVDDALQLAVKNSRRYENEKVLLYLSALSLTGERYEFGPQFFARSAATVERTSNDERLGRVNSRFGVGQLLKSGGVLGATLANDVLRYYTGDSRKSVISIISVNLAQPLLRGFGLNNAAVENLNQAERDVIYAVRRHANFQDSFALEIVNDYFNLLAQKDIIRNRYTNYLGRVQSTRRLEERAQDRERISDVDQARQAELTAKNNYVNQIAAYRNSLDQFKIKLGVPLGEQLQIDDSALAEVKTAGLVPVRLNTDAAYRMAVQKQLLLLNDIDRFEDSKRKIKVAADRLRPGLDLFADATLQSTPPTDYTRFNANKVRASAGVELDLPLDRLRERNAYRASLISFESAIRDLTLTLDSLKDNIDGGLRTLEQRRQNFEIQKGALVIADRRVESTTLRIQAGLAEVRDLVDAQDAQIQAQNAVTAALVDYQNVRLQLMLDLGALESDLPKFWLKDHVPAFLPGTVAAEPAAQAGEQPVFPPEQYFNN